MFEVGKKYVYIPSTNKMKWVCVHVGGYYIILESESGHPSIIWDTHGTQWKEYKEPRSLTRWVNVWQKPDGNVEFSCSNYTTKERAQQCTVSSGGWKHLDTIEVKWSERSSSN